MPIVCLRQSATNRSLTVPDMNLEIKCTTIISFV